MLIRCMYTRICYVPTQQQWQQKICLCRRITLIPRSAICSPSCVGVLLIYEIEKQNYIHLVWPNMTPTNTHSYVFNFNRLGDMIRMFFNLNIIVDLDLTRNDLNYFFFNWIWINEIVLRNISSFLSQIMNFKQ